MRRKVALAALAASTLVLGAAITHLRATGSRPPCGLEEYQAIRLGMTLDEAVAVVGVPPGDYTGGHVRDFRSETEYGQQHFIRPASRKSASHVQWVGARGMTSSEKGWSESAGSLPSGRYSRHPTAVMMRERRHPRSN